jgi:hypothetical protein
MTSQRRASGNPAVMGRTNMAYRPEILRRQLSLGLPFSDSIQRWADYTNVIRGVNPPGRTLLR